jgi:hypothetical protein
MSMVVKSSRRQTSEVLRIQVRVGQVNSSQVVSIQSRVRQVNSSEVPQSRLTEMRQIASIQVRVIVRLM